MMTSYLQTWWRNLKRQPSTAFFSLIGLLALLSGLVSNLAYAVPMMTTYQGHLADASGNPLNATVSMTFALYDTSTGGTPLWTETHPNVTITQGVFSVVLGSVVSFENEDFEGERYLGMTVEDDAEMMPRELLTSAAFAIRAGVAESVVDSAVGTDKLAESAVTTDKVADNTVTTVKIADGAVTGAKIADLAGHSATELDDIASAGSGAIITNEERDRWNGLQSDLNIAAARAVCYSALTGNNNHSIIMIPLPDNNVDLDDKCHTNINNMWHAGGVAKGRYFYQDCPVDLTNRHYGGGYTSYVTEAYFEANRGNYSLCNATNAFICCSPQFPN